MEDSARRQGGFLRGLFFGVLLGLVLAAALAVLVPLKTRVPEAEMPREESTATELAPAPATRPPMPAPGTRETPAAEPAKRDEPAALPAVPARPAPPPPVGGETAEPEIRTEAPPRVALAETRPEPAGIAPAENGLLTTRPQPAAPPAALSRTAPGLMAAPDRPPPRWAPLAPPPGPPPDTPVTERVETATPPEPRPREATAPSAPETTSTALVTTEPGPEPAPATEDHAPAQLTPAPVPELPAWIAYASEFEDEEGAPLLGVLLEITPDALADIERLAALDLPVSFIIPSDLPDAAGIARRLRRAGRELFVRPAGDQALVLGLTRSEVTERLEAAFSLVPEAVGVCDIDGALAGNAVLAETVARVLIRRGHASVTGRAEARNAMVRVAVGNNLRHLIVQRRIDEIRSPQAIATALERAAFIARNDGAALVAGHTYPETIAALEGWAKARRARRDKVRLAPGSALLRRAGRG